MQKSERIKTNKKRWLLLFSSIVLAVGIIFFIITSIKQKKNRVVQSSYSISKKFI